MDNLWDFWSDIFHPDKFEMLRKTFIKVVNECLFEHSNELLKPNFDVWQYAYLQSHTCCFRKFRVSKTGYIGMAS